MAAISTVRPGRVDATVTFTNGTKISFECRKGLVLPEHLIEVDRTRPFSTSKFIPIEAQDLVSARRAAAQAMRDFRARFTALRGHTLPIEERFSR